MSFAEIVTNPALFGMFLFPLSQGSKVPLKGTAGQDDATNDPAILAQWAKVHPHANAGVHCAPSGLYVVDVDCGGEKVGGESWDALVLEHGHVETLTVRTPSGGLHFYYRMPEGDVLTNTSGKLGQHIDTRGNGYVVAPGSVVNGVTYEIVSDVEIAELPEWIADAVRKPKRGASTRPILPYELADPTEVERRIVALATELADAPDGHGNHEANKIGFMVGGYVGAGQVSAHVAQSILEGAFVGWTFRDRASERGLYSTLARAIAEGAGSPRPWTAASFPEAGLSFPEPADATAEATADAEVTTTDFNPLEEKPKPPPNDWNTDAGQARWIVGDSDDLLHCKGVGWLKWDGVRWAAISEEQVGKAVVAFYKREFGKAMKKWQAKPDDDAARTRCGFLAKQQNASKVKAVLTSLKWVTSLDGAEPWNRLDAHPYLLNTPAGVLDLRTLTTHPHDKRLLLTKVAAGSYSPGCTHRDWDKALSALPADSLRWLQLRMGAAITGVQMSDDAVFLHGGGSNGKSVFCNDGVVRALGDYGLMKSSELIGSRKADQSAATPEKAELRGARFVLIEELPEEFALSTKAVKELSGTGQINARRLYQDSVVFDATHSLFVNTNHVPNVTEPDWGTWRRLTLVPFPITFTAHPTGEHERLGDRHLVQRIRSNESGQFDAIVTWLAQGAHAVIADGAALVVGKRAVDDGRAEPIKDATRAWRMQSDRLMAYADDCLTLDPDGVVAKTDLVWHFNRWLRDQGASKWSARLIGERMKDHPSFPKVTERHQQAGDELSRPPQPEQWNDALPELPARTRVLAGLRFADPNGCTCSNAAHGIHAPDCRSAA